MKKLILVLLMIGSVALADKEPKRKYGIVLQAGAETQEGAARAMHALIYAKDLLENGHSVVLIFDGAGTGWAKEMSNAESPLYPHYSRVHTLGVVEEICDYCAEHFDVKDSLSEIQQKLLSGDYEGHPSLAKWIGKGYQIIVL